MKDLDLRLWQMRYRDYLELVCDYSPDTIELYTRELKGFFPFLERQGVSNLNRLTSTHLEGYRQELFVAQFRGKALTRVTQSIRLNSVKQFVRYLFRANYLLLDLAAHLKLPTRAPQLPRQILSEKEVLRLLEQPDTATPEGICQRAILEVFYGTALRNSELRLLQIHQVDLDAEQLRIDHGKGRKPRVLPLGEEALLWLENYLGQVRPQLVGDPAETLVFPATKGGPVHRSRLALWMRQLGKRAGLDKTVTPHILRHSCATHMLRRGANLRHLQELLGHSSLDTTQIYTRVDVADLAKAVQQYHPREQWKEW